MLYVIGSPDQMFNSYIFYNAFIFYRILIINLKHNFINIEKSEFRVNKQIPVYGTFKKVYTKV